MFELMLYVPVNVLSVMSEGFSLVEQVQSNGRYSLSFEDTAQYLCMRGSRKFYQRGPKFKFDNVFFFS